jgi:hypothetical protein
MLDRQGVYEFDRFAGTDYTYSYRDDLCKESRRQFDMRSPRDQSTSTGFISCKSEIGSDNAENFRLHHMIEDTQLVQSYSTSSIIQSSSTCY